MQKLIFTSLLMFTLFPGIGNSTPEDPQIEEVHAGPERQFEKISNAVVQIRTQYGYGTGTVFQKSGKLYVITANHVVSSRAGEKVFIRVIRGESESDALISYSDPERDIAILLVSSHIDNVMPYSIKFSRRGIMPGDKTGYCGFPNRPELACFSGNVSQVSKSYIHIHSYAFGGASGSLVIDSRGRVVGVLSAIEVGNFIGMPTPLEDVVWVSPVTPEVFESL